MSAVLDAPPAAAPVGKATDWRADSRSAAPPDLLTGFRFPRGYRVTPQDHGRPVSRQEFLELRAEASGKIKRACGKLVVTPKTGRPHRRAAYTFRLHLSRYWVDHPDRVRDFEAERWVLPGDHTHRFPDAAVLLEESPLGEDHLDPTRVPDVLIEFVSPGRESRDRGYTLKRADHYALGTREYVIVDFGDRTVTVLRWEPDGYAEAAVLGPTDAYTTPLLPGLSVPLTEAIGGGVGDDDAG